MAATINTSQCAMCEFFTGTGKRKVLCSDKHTFSIHYVLTKTNLHALTKHALTKNNLL